MSKQNVDGILSRLRDALGVDSDTALARELGVTQGAVSNWRTRDSVSLAVVVERAEAAGVNLHWLLTGEQPQPGSVRRITVRASGRQVVVDIQPGDVIEFG